MDNDKAFAVYALVLAGGLLTVIATLVASGIATIPPALWIAEHVALSLCMRAAYKGFGGFSWDDWSILPSRTTELAEGPEAAPEPEAGITREAA